MKHFGPWTCPICPVICPVCPADNLPLEFDFQHNSAQTGLAIYVARGSRSGTAEITAVVFTTAVAGNFFGKMRCGNWTSSRWLQM